MKQDPLPLIKTNLRNNRRIFKIRALMDEQKDKSLNTAANRSENTREVQRITWIGFWYNLAIAAAKITCGWVGSSRAVVADGFHSLSDVATDVVLLIGVRFWNRPADECHPYGHRRIETVITFFMGAGLALTAAGIIYGAMKGIRVHHDTVPSWIAFWAAVGSIISKEWLYRWTIAAGRKTGSSAVIANAWEHRSDVFSSIPAAIAVIVAILLPGWNFVDHVGAVIVSVLIFKAAWAIAYPAYKELIDAAASPQALNSIRETALKTPKVLQVHGIRTRTFGSGIQVDLHVMVDGSMTVVEGHDVSMNVKRRIIEQIPGVHDALVHLEPLDSPPIFKEYMRS